MLGLFRENVKVALGSIRTQLLRTVLTIVIIAIGITALVGILTIVTAIDYNMNSSFASMGSKHNEGYLISLSLQLLFYMLKSSILIFDQ
jgi:ABC-type antimicrobial peptide transport system permease subunit